MSLLDGLTVGMMPNHSIERKSNRLRRSATAHVKR